ncbi:MbtH family protein [Streptomyces griseofuscus]|uniref:MbtH family protein n=1 Tax=Streptomyces griseofuscus TaxID=146922 RepID=UPI003686E065
MAGRAVSRAPSGPWRIPPDFAGPAETSAITPDGRPGSVTTHESTSQERFVVVINIEEQHSIWPEGRRIPDGWNALGEAGPREECLRHIAEIWTDMRPASLRRSVDGQAASGR